MSAREPILDRLLSLPGEDAAPALSSKATALASFVLFAASSDFLFDRSFQWGVPLALCLVGTLFARTARAAHIAAALFWFAMLSGLPVVANHMYVVALLFGLAALLRLDDEDEQRLYLQGARWLVVAIFFWSGAKKLWFGTYFGGEYLGYMIATDGRFSEFFSLWVPAGEIQRLQGLAGAVETGPYAVDSWLVLGLSNAVWLGEIGVALLLLWPAARRWAWIGGVAMLFGIEVIAREVFFGVLTTGLLLAFHPSDWIRRALPFLAVVLLGLVAWSLAGFPSYGIT